MVKILYSSEIPCNGLYTVMGKMNQYCSIE